MSPAMCILGAATHGASRRDSNKQKSIMRHKRRSHRIMAVFFFIFFLVWLCASWRCGRPRDNRVNRRLAPRHSVRFGRTGNGRRPDKASVHSFGNGEENTSKHKKKTKVATRAGQMHAVATGCITSKTTGFICALAKGVVARYCRRWSATHTTQTWPSGGSNPTQVRL